MCKSFQKPFLFVSVISFSVSPVQNLFSVLSVSSLLSTNHLQGWRRSAENPLPAHTGQTEEEDSEGESLKYTECVITAEHFINCVMVPVVKVGLLSLSSAAEPVV